MFVYVSMADAVEMPGFMRNVPPGHFAGVSVACNSLQKAKSSSLLDVAKQILGCIDGKYDYAYKSKITGSPKSPRINIQDTLEKTASGIVLDIDRHIVRSSYSRDNFGNYIFFALVNYPRTKILEMRRLSKGSNLTASILSRSGSKLIIKVSESNGVAVTLASIQGTINKTNQFAPFYRFCIWKVPYGSQDTFSITIDSVQVQGNSKMLKLDIQKLKKDWKDLILGAVTTVSFTVTGFDEIGRPVKAPFKY